jgi:hypothetical protein
VAAAIIGIAVAWSPALVSDAMAFDETSVAAVNVDANGLAMRGYDPVTYHTSGNPTVGDPAITAVYEGATYRFATSGNQELFVADPAKYAPAFGGFCAMGTALEKKFDGDPNVWRIVDGTLYLNVGEPAQKRFLEDVPGNITKATTNWPKIKDKAPKDL